MSEGTDCLLFVSPCLFRKATLCIKSLGRFLGRPVVPCCCWLFWCFPPTHSRTSPKLVSSRLVPVMCVVRVAWGRVRVGSEAVAAEVG